MSIHEGTIQAGSTSIDYISFGRGVTPLVLIPGLSLRDISGSGPSLSFLYRDFARDYRI